MPVILNPWDEERKQRNEMRRQRAMRESPDQKRKAELQAQATLRKNKEEIAKWKDSYAFDNWSIAHRFVKLLESVRDRFTPKNPDDIPCEAFITAISMLPEAREDEREQWLEYASAKMEGGD